MTPTVAPPDKATAIAIQRAMAQPGAKGMRGFLLWTKAAFPANISGPILAAARKHVGGTPGGSLAGGNFGYAAPRRYRRPLQGFGDYTVADPNNPDNLINLTTGQSLSTDASGNTVIINSDGSTSAVNSVDGTIAATPAAPASTSWMSDITSAVAGATQALLGVKQVDAAQQIFNVNLQRAQQGLAPIPTNPTQYGLAAPTVNVGVSSATLTPILYVVGGIALLLMLGSALKRS